MFSEQEYAAIERRFRRQLKILVDKQVTTNLLAEYQRSGADFLEDLVKNNLEFLFGDFFTAYNKSEPGNKSLADFSCRNGDFFLANDVKTHNLDKKGSKPNLVSFDRLQKFYHDSDKNYFMILSIEYRVVDGKVEIGEVRYFPIETLCMDCVAVGALGRGQLQIKNMKTFRVDLTNTREGFMKHVKAIGRKLYKDQTKTLEHVWKDENSELPPLSVHYLIMGKSNDTNG